jgi:hypothetical protein
LNNYLKAKKECKRVYDYKEKSLLASKRTKLKSAMKSDKSLWKTVKSFRRPVQDQKVGLDRWKNYFEQLLNRNVTIEESFLEEVDQFLDQHRMHCDECESNFSEFLNDPITESEILNAINKSSNGKAPGVDGIINELLKHSKLILIPVLLELFNSVMNCGGFPKEWSEAMIIPIHKKGPADDPDNYRGISLLPSIAKLFTKIINERCVKWKEFNDKYKEEQCGFRKERGVIDQIFTLQAIAQKHLSKKKGRYYCAFIDFSKAFDSISHNLLWFRLYTEGMHGKFMKVMISMYENLKSCVLTPEGITEFF